MKKLCLSIAALISMASTAGAVALEVNWSHQIKQADSAAANIRYYKDTVYSNPFILDDATDRVWFTYHRLAPVSGTDSNFANDSLKVQIQTSMDNATWTTVTLIDSPRIAFLPLSDSGFVITTTGAKTFNRDSTALMAGPIIRARFIVADSGGAWVAAIKGNTYARRLQLHITEIK
jgi:hypothetical protein